MLREALRRLLWLGPTLLVVTLPTFWALTRATDLAAALPTNPLPLFFNPSPLGARERAEEAFFRVASNGSVEAEETLVRLGGAALPHVLPLFDSLGPEARVRVALALAPVARRMGVGGVTELTSPDTAVVFWSRFWEEHSIDFRPQVVHRAVRRFVEGPSPLRRAEVLGLDTYALEDLVQSMRRPRSDSEMAEARSLCDIAAHVAGLPLTIAPGASLLDARHVVNEWQVFFSTHRGDYVAFTGISRLGATLRETRYVRWLEQLRRRGFGNTKSGVSVLRTLSSRGPLTLFLLLSALIGGYPIAAFAGVSRVLGLARASWPLVAGAIVACLTPVGLAGLLLRGARATPSLGLAGITMAVVFGAAATRHARTLFDRASEHPHVRTSLAFGASPLHAALKTVRISAGTLVALAVADLPALATAAFVVERAFSLHGLGEITTSAVRSGDLTWLMALALLGTFVLGVAQIGGDVVARLLDPRHQRTFRTDGSRT